MYHMQQKILYLIRDDMYNFSKYIYISVGAHWDTDFGVLSPSQLN